MACRNCCSACDGNVPESWTVTIDTHEYTLVRTKTACDGTAVASGQCTWKVSIDQELWSCDDGACVFLQVIQSATVDGIKADWTLFVYDADDVVLAEWTFREDYPADCMEEKTLTVVAVGTCQGDAEATLDITPGPIGRCCPCSACCDQCSGSDYTASKWRLTLDGHTFIVPRRVRQDEPVDGDTSEVCIWSKRINTELFGTVAKDLVVRMYTDGSGIDVFYAEVELFKTDDTRHTLWQNGALSAHDCGVDIENVNYAAGIGSSQAEVVLEPLGLRYCPTVPSGSGGACICCTDLASEEYDIDFGAGGWTNNTNNNCAAVAGVFTVALQPTVFLFCRWNYQDDAFGENESSDPECGPVDGALHISLQRERLADSRCYWQVVVSITGVTGSVLSDCCGLRAVYRSAYSSTPESCQISSPITLTKVSDGGGATSFPPPCCDGALPATITLESV